ncbi:6-phospho-3-hexuloisomerase [Fructilactobacillus frigidiflavus]|uniref:6-phospho-3-hexuloisomerase n=1 Tax=Fructilactobacillus frigidiflavus TaxID=3242688 RepID=UPI003756A9DC
MKWDEILQELSQHSIPVTETDLKLIKDAKHIFVYGGGRSGFGLKGFAMRLVHMGKLAYVVGETTTPAITAGDLLIVASSSGTTQGTLNIVTEAKKAQADVWLWSTHNDSVMAKLANQITILPGKSKNAVGEHATSQQPMGSLFEQSVWLFGDAVTLAYMQAQGVSEQQMKQRHANLE